MSNSKLCVEQLTALMVCMTVLEATVPGRWDNWHMQKCGLRRLGASSTSQASSRQERTLSSVVASVKQRGFELSNSVACFPHCRCFNFEYPGLQALLEDSGISIPFKQVGPCKYIVGQSVNSTRLNLKIVKGRLMAQRGGGCHQIMSVLEKLTAPQAY